MPTARLVMSSCARPGISPAHGLLLSGPSQRRLITTSSPSTRYHGSQRALWLLLVSTSAIAGGAGFSLYYRRRVECDSTSQSQRSQIEEDISVAQPLNRRPLGSVPFSDLLRSLFVYTVCAIPPLVDAGPTVIDWCRSTRLPGVWAVTEAVMRWSFFRQFVGGETADDCIPVLSSLSRTGLGTMLNLSLEVHPPMGGKTDAKSSTASSLPSTVHQSVVDELLHSIEVTSSFASAPSAFNAASPEEAAMLESRPSRDGSTMLAVKLSGLLADASVLQRASAAIVSREWFSEPPVPAPPRTVNGSGPCGGLAIPVAALDKADVDTLRDLWDALRLVTQRAKDKGNVRIAIDAEYSWYQPAIDALYEAIAYEYNRVPDARELAKEQPQGAVPGPLIFNTFQAYLRRTPSHLSASLERARTNGYSLGVKLVRGAYVETENKTWERMAVAPPPPGRTDEERASVHWASPVWATKDLTDRCFDACSLRLIEEIAEDWQKAAGGNGGARQPAPPPALSVVFASHNAYSAMLITRRMLELGLVSAPGTPPTHNVKLGQAEDHAATPLVNLVVAPGVRGRLTFAQLLGMSDALTRRLQLAFDQDSGGAGPHLNMKYVPYGPLDLVMPYLVRRAAENKSVMGGGAATREIRLIFQEMWQRALFR